MEQGSVTVSCWALSQAYVLSREVMAPLSCTLTISLHFWSLSKGLLTSTQWLRWGSFFSFSISSSLPPPYELFHPKCAVSLISKSNNRGGIYCGDFGAELNCIPVFVSCRTSQMVQDTLCTVGCIALLCIDAARTVYFTAVWNPAARSPIEDEEHTFLSINTMHNVIHVNVCMFPYSLCTVQSNMLWSNWKGALLPLYKYLSAFYYFCRDQTWY